MDARPKAELVSKLFPPSIIPSNNREQMKTIRSDQSVFKPHTRSRFHAHARRKAINGTHKYALCAVWATATAPATVANHTHNPKYPKIKCHATTFSSCLFKWWLLLETVFVCWARADRNSPSFHVIWSLQTVRFAAFPRKRVDFYYHVSLFFFCVK